MNIFDFFRGDKEKESENITEKKENKTIPVFSTHILQPPEYHPEYSIQKQIALDSDSCACYESCVPKVAMMADSRIPPALFNWYASQGFIGYQTCAIMAQNWLISKACRMPAEDAVRPGWKITSADGDQELSADLLQRLKESDRYYKIHKNLVEMEFFKRVFGIRLLKFVVESDDPDFYEKPFNIDGVEPFSYRGISQIDPYWVTPELTMANMSPDSLTFYEPQYWRVGGKRIHKSHLWISRGDEVADILKPSYLYGGVPVVQQIFERVYAAERTANEAPILTLTKRLNIQKADLDMIAQDPARFFKRLQEQTELRDNLGIKVIGLEEEYIQHDTQLTDLDSVIMTQYQLVAAIARVPATRLLGTSPKGFNSTGEHELKTYHEFLSSIQEGDMHDILREHYRRVLKSDFPNYNGAVDIIWNPIDKPSGEELATLNSTKAQYYSTLAQTGAIDGQDIRSVLVGDPDSGFNDISEELPEDLTNEQFLNEFNNADNSLSPADANAIFSQNSNANNENAKGFNPPAQQNLPIPESE